MRLRDVPLLLLRRSSSRARAQLAYRLLLSIVVASRRS